MFISYKRIHELVYHFLSIKSTNAMPLLRHHNVLSPQKCKISQLTITMFEYVNSHLDVIRLPML